MLHSRYSHSFFISLRSELFYSRLHIWKFVCRRCTKNSTGKVSFAQVIFSRKKNRTVHTKKQWKLFSIVSAPKLVGRGGVRLLIEFCCMSSNRANLSHSRAMMEKLKNELEIRDNFVCSARAGFVCDFFLIFLFLSMLTQGKWHGNFMRYKFSCFAQSLFDDFDMAALSLLPRLYTRPVPPSIRSILSMKLCFDFRFACSISRHRSRKASLTCCTCSAADTS